MSETRPFYSWTGSPWTSRLPPPNHQAELQILTVRAEWSTSCCVPKCDVSEYVGSKRPQLDEAVAYKESFNSPDHIKLHALPWWLRALVRTPDRLTTLLRSNHVL